MMRWILTSMLGAMLAGGLLAMDPAPNSGNTNNYDFSSIPDYPVPLPIGPDRHGYDFSGLPANPVPLPIGPDRRGGYGDHQFGGGDKPIHLMPVVKRYLRTEVVSGSRRSEAAWDSGELVPCVFDSSKGPEIPRPIVPEVPACLGPDIAKKNYEGYFSGSYSGPICEKTVPLMPELKRYLPNATGVLKGQKLPFIKVAKWQQESGMQPRYMRKSCFLDLVAWNLDLVDYPSIEGESLGDSGEYEWYEFKKPFIDDIIPLLPAG